MAINLNNSTPAAPAGSTNVTWQKDTSGNVSAYVTAAPELTGDNVDLTAQSADISATDILTSPTSGLYRVSMYISVSQVASGTGSTLPSVILTWTDQDSAQSMSLTATPTSTGNALTTVEQATAVLSVSATAAITYATSGYASNGTTAMNFSLHIRLEAL